MHTPGHTPGSTRDRIYNALVTEITLFVDGRGRGDLWEATHASCWPPSTLTDKRPATTVLYPGHDDRATPISTLDTELAANHS